jgi:hypothetical protein
LRHNSPHFGNDYDVGDYLSPTFNKDCDSYDYGAAVMCRNTVALIMACPCFATNSIVLILPIMILHFNRAFAIAANLQLQTIAID